MAFIPEDKLLEIKDAAPIEEVVGQVVKLAQKGKNLLGLCPFHADTSPSFTVAPDKGIFHCFGCGAGGNVFSFVMQYHRLSFPEAVQELARRYGIPLALRDLGPEGAKTARKRQLAYEIHEKAAAFYENMLKGPAGQVARDYLESRGLTPEAIRAFHLGYAPDDWDALRRHLAGQGIPLDAAQEVGLLVARPHGGYYDRFRHRIMFPISDRQGRVIAFGGRVLGQEEPKYLNSPESGLYAKGRNLYGLPQAADALRRTGVALLVEGYLDLLALQVHGVGNVLATLGTALTREQVRLLKSLASQVVLLFDGDLAGAKAMKRAFPLFAQEGLAVRALPLPAGMDPDSYVNAQGAELFRAPWEAAQPWFTYVLEDLIRTHGLEIEGRVRILEELRPFFQAVAEPVEQDLWGKVAAQRLGIDEATLRRSLAGAAPVAPERLRAAGNLALSLERRLLRYVLGNPKAVSVDELEEWAVAVEDQELRGLVRLIIDLYREHGGLDHGLLLNRVEAAHLRQQICSLSLGEDEFCGPAAAWLADEWRRNLSIRRLRRASAALKEKLAKAAASGGGDEIGAILAQRQEIERQLEDLKVSTT